MTKFKWHTCIISYHFSVCTVYILNYVKSSVSNNSLYNIYTQFVMDMFRNSPCERYIKVPVFEYLQDCFYLILMKAKNRDIDILF